MRRQTNAPFVPAQKESICKEHGARGHIAAVCKKKKAEDAKAAKDAKTANGDKLAKESPSISLVHEPIQRRTHCNTQNSKKLPKCTMCPPPPLKDTTTPKHRPDFLGRPKQEGADTIARLAPSTGGQDKPPSEEQKEMATHISNLKAAIDASRLLGDEDYVKKKEADMQKLEKKAQVQPSHSDLSTIHTTVAGREQRWGHSSKEE